MIPEEKSVLLQHLLLPHHGQPEYGTAVEPQCAESKLLSLIDLMDSRKESYEETLANTEPGTFFSVLPFVLQESHLRVIVTALPQFHPTSWAKCQFR